LDVHIAIYLRQEKTMKKKIIIILLTIGLFTIAATPILAEGVYPAWHQGFEQGTAGWFTNDTSGPEGWCGDITRYERGSGPVMPSIGKGYAVVANGACNEYWMNNGWSESGPYAPFGGYSESWPQSGFVTKLDIYLDPSWEDGTNFTYAVSAHLLDENEFRYFLFPVAKESGALQVVEHEVSEAGWYTFRVRFREQSGHLAVDFELAQHGQVLFAQPMTATAFTGEQTSSFEISGVGTGYSWFVSLSPGLQLPIDQHMYRPGE
jgi:hypothetical protein